MRKKTFSIMLFLSERVQLQAQRADIETNIRELIDRLYKEITVKTKVKNK